MANFSFILKKHTHTHTLFQCSSVPVPGVLIVGMAQRDVGKKNSEGWGRE